MKEHVVKVHAKIAPYKRHSAYHEAAFKIQSDNKVIDFQKVEKLVLKTKDNKVIYLEKISEKSVQNEIEYICEICKKKSKNQKGLKIHKSKAHGNKNESFICEVCDGVFQTAGGLATHVTRSHKKPRPLKPKVTQRSTEGRRSTAVAEGFSPSATATAAEGI